MEFYLISREGIAESLLVQRSPRRRIGLVFKDNSAVLDFDISTRTRHAAENFLKNRGITIQPNP